MHRTTATSSGDGEEREVKLAVAQGFVLPPLSQLVGVSADDRGEERLHALYWDTAGLGLARAGVALRHRSGMWTFKGRSRRDGDSLVREEVEVAGDADTVPASLRARIDELVDARELRVVAQLDSLRRTIDVRSGDEIGEVVHDRVSVMGSGGEVLRFEEVEVEFEAHSHALADRVVHMVIASGATVDKTSKYRRALRALGWDPPEVVG